MSNNQLTNQLRHTAAYKLLIPTYKSILEQLADNELDLSKVDSITYKKALTNLLKRENEADLQSIFFTEKLLENFVETHFTLPDSAELRSEFQQKAKHLIETCLILTRRQRETLIAQLDQVNLEGLHKIIEVYREAHHKQNQYLQIFAEKDPNASIKFEVLVNKSNHNQA